MKYVNITFNLINLKDQTMLILRYPLHLVSTMSRYTKRSIVLSVDISLCILTVWLALYLRLGEFVSLSGQYLWAVVISLSLALPIFMAYGLYRAIFRHSGWPALITVAQAIGIYSLLYASIITAMGIHGIPRTVGLIQPILLFLAIAGSRLLANYCLSGVYNRSYQQLAAPRALIYGAGNAGRQLMAAMGNSHEINIIGFIDDDERLHGHILNGQPIYSSTDLERLISSKDVSKVLLALPSISRKRRNEILDNILNHHLAVQTLPRLSDLAHGKVSISDLKELDIDDLLGRDPVTPNHILLSKNITGKTVLISGAGGSIGSELCRQAIKLKPSKLLLLEISEYALYSIHSELEKLEFELSSSEESHPKNCIKNSILIPLLGSTQDRKRVNEIISTWRPNTIYHAAAYKHVPMVEHNLAEGVKNNVFGTLTIAEVAIENNVKDFVLISTDKAVRPTNIMGASKRLAEMCLQAIYDREKNGKNIRLSMVRFGNVLGSSGSVIPKFRKQIHTSDHITLTHPDITRFFMTIPEAAQLVLQAGSMAKGGDVFILDMGEPIKIFDLATRMIELSGLTVKDADNPDGDIEIIITGLRPGEKLYEELLISDDTKPTSHPRIMRAQDQFLRWNNLNEELSKLYSELSSNNIKSVREILEKLVTGYQPNGNIVDWTYVEQSSTHKKTI